MIRIKNFNSTGVAPDGRLYAGDLLAIQDAAAGLSDFLQTIDLASIRVGDSAIQLLKFGTLDARLTAALRADGIIRGLGGLYAGTYTTAGRNAIPAGFRPQGLEIFNTDTVRREINLGTDAVPNWQPSGGGGDYGTSFPGSGLFNGYRFTLFVPEPLIGGQVAWNFVYRADLDATYPWHFIGGPKITANSNAGVGAVSSPITAPRGGYYNLSCQATLFVNSMDTQVHAYLWYSGGAFSEFGYASWSSTIGMGMGMIAGYSGERRMPVVSAGQQFGCYTVFTGSTAGAVINAYSQIQPIKLA